jgi:hypothetical protein
MSSGFVDIEEGDEEDLYGDEDNENEENDKKLTEIESNILLLHRSMVSDERVNAAPQNIKTMNDILEDSEEYNSEEEEEERKMG